MKIEEDSLMKRKAEGYNARLDESLGERRGPEKVFRESLKSRRDESKGMEKRDGGQAYAADHGMDEGDKSRLKHHMMAAHHKFMSQHHRRKMYKKK